MSELTRQSPPICSVWAVASYGDEPVRRWFGSEPLAITDAIRIARSSAPEGAVSVWVQRDDGGQIVWAAGVKARELKEAGAEIVGLGEVRHG